MGEIARTPLPYAAIRWLWTAPSVSARVARASLVPAAAVYAAGTRIRAELYARKWLPSRSAGVPTIAVGNLSVGGTGKTPLASWVAAHCAERGLAPGIVLRGYGSDETRVHQDRLPGAIVVEGPDRPQAAGRAVRAGARVLVLDDAFQRLDLHRDLNLLLVSAEAAQRTRWTLPAGPWRESWAAAWRADIVVVTWKRAGREAARALAREIARSRVWPAGVAIAQLALCGLTALERGPEAGLSQGLRSARQWSAKNDRRWRRMKAVLRGAAVLAVSGIADPESFEHQLASLGARVRSARYRDHHRYTEADARRLAAAAKQADYVVTTHKDAVKLRTLWPTPGPLVLVAHLEPRWEDGGNLVVGKINDLLTRHYTTVMC